MKLYLPFINEQLKKNKEKFQEKQLYVEIELPPIVINKSDKKEESIIIIDVL